MATMTFANAKIQVARTIGGHNDADQLAAAGDAIAFAIDEWNWRHNWRYLLQDNNEAITLASTITSSGTGNKTLTTSTTDGFKNVYVGNRIWDINGDPDTTGTFFAAGTKIASKDATNPNTVITVDTNLESAMDSDDGAETDGRIGIVAGTSVYRLPHPAKRPYSARLMSRNRNLIHKELREIDRVSRTIDEQGLTTHYSLYTDGTYLATSLDDRAGWIKLYRTPDYNAANELLLRYYRPIGTPSADGNTLDVPERYIRALLNLAKYYYLVDKDAEAARTQEHKQRAEMAIKACIADDVGSEDREVALIPQTRYGQSYGSTDVPIDPWYGS
jgi:hypothetical protein